MGLETEQNFLYSIKTGKEEDSSRRDSRIRQGDDLSPTLLVLVIQLEMEDAIKYYKNEGASVVIAKNTMICF